MSILLFEDQYASLLYPVTTGRPVFSITCGSYRLIDLVISTGEPLRWIVRPHLRDVVREDFAQHHAPHSQAREPILLLNAAVVPSIAAKETIVRLLRDGRPGIVSCGKRFAAAVLPKGHALPSEQSSADELAAFTDGLNLDPLDAELPLLEYPHDIVRHHLAIFRENLDTRLKDDRYRQTADGVFVAPDARIGQHVVLDTSDGPIVIDQQARIGPYVYISGPAYIGPRARVLEHAAIKECSALGHTTKIGGEIEATIIEPYTNKQHHGFLGHSYLGSWINLGAGTCNSDLKNTYGPVNMIYDGSKVKTEMQFVGCFIGDYAKTAINTGIFTGKTIGVCSMVYGFVTTNVPSFVNYARSFGQVTETPVGVMISTQARMFARRNVQQRDCDKQLLFDMYELTRHERQWPGEPLSL